MGEEGPGSQVFSLEPGHHALLYGTPHRQKNFNKPCLHAFNLNTRKGAGRLEETLAALAGWY